MPYSQEPGLKPDLLNAHPGLKAKAPAVHRKRRNWILLMQEPIKANNQKLSYHERFSDGYGSIRYNRK